MAPEPGVETSTGAARFARLSVASWLTEFAAFGSQDVDRALLNDTEESAIIVYNQTSGGRTVFAGLAGVRDCFAGLFVWSVTR